MRRAAGAAILGTLLALAGCDDPTEPPGSFPTEWAAVSAGDFHTCALAVTDEAYCWGSNAFGQLGSDAGRLAPWPRAVAGGHRFRAVTAGFGHTCGLTSDGVAYCWGRGEDGQLGTGSTGDAYSPERVAGPFRFRQISAGHSHTCAVTFDGEGLCWGRNVYGQLGTGTAESSDVPVRVANGGINFFTISAGHTHSCGIGVTGITYCWGDNRRAQLGTGSFRPSPAPTSVRTAQTFIAISAGYETTCGLTPYGAPFCWGSNEAGRLAAPEIDLAGNPLAVAVSEPFNVVSVSSEAHVCGVSSMGGIYCWGRGSSGQLGDGAASGGPGLVAVRVAGSFVGVTTGLRHSCGLDSEGSLYCWGSGGSGQLGTGRFTDQLLPIPVAGDS